MRLTATDILPRPASARTTTTATATPARGGTSSDDDAALLATYVRTRCERSFARLVERHIHLVYAAARRQVHGDVHLAEDVTQGVFIVLARRAATLRHAGVLPAWLLTVTRHTASNALTTSDRRRHHE